MGKDVSIIDSGAVHSLAWVETALQNKVREEEKIQHENKLWYIDRRNVPNACSIF
jgi:hypothetical protein